MTSKKNILYKVLALALICALCCTFFAGCDNDPVNPVDPVVPIDPVDPADPDDPDDPTQPVDPDAESLRLFVNALRRMEPVLEALARTISGGSAVYNANDNFFFWVTMYNMASMNAIGTPGVTLNSSNGIVSIPASLMMEYANACFANFSAFPPFPEYFGAVNFDSELDVYEVIASDLTCERSTADAAFEAGQYTVTFSMSLGDEPYIFGVTLVENETGSTAYPYSVIDMVMISGPNDPE